jgi:predicted alpha/beta superfamily hydrolase
MLRSLCLALVVFLLCGCAAPHESVARSPEKEIITFAVTNDVGFGNEAFVTGNHADLGSDDPVLGRKLRWTPGNVWTGQIAIQSGTDLDYRYIKRDGSASEYCQTANTTNLSPLLSLTTTSQPAAPYNGKTILYHSPWTNALILHQSGSNWINAPMTRIGPGRSAGEHLHRIDGIGEAGEPIQFVPNNNAGQYDNAPYPGFGLNDYYTSLDVFFLQDKHVLNYRPPVALSTPRIIVTNITSTVTGISSRSIRVYLPRGYDQNTWKRYPVLYFHDGQNVFDPGGPFGSWSADAAGTREISQGRMRECILVGVDNTSARLQEYKPPEDGGTGDLYGQFLVNNVRSFINANYRTLADRGNTLTMGSSMGGLISAFLGWNTNFNSVFGNIGVMSSAFWISPQFAATIGGEPKRDLRIYFDWGSAESSSIWTQNWIVYNYWLADGYALNRELSTVVGCGQGHNEAAWAARLPDAYRFLLNPWDEANRLALELHPPRLRVAPLDLPGNRILLEYPTLKGAGYQLERARTLPATSWDALTNSAPESLAWSIREVDAEIPSDGAPAFWRLLAIPPP